MPQVIVRIHGLPTELIVTSRIKRLIHWREIRKVNAYARSFGLREVKKIFGQYGPVHSVIHFRKGHEAMPSGSALVKMEEADARRAISGLYGRELMGSTLTLSISNSPV